LAVKNGHGAVPYDQKQINADGGQNYDKVAAWVITLPRG
jgi:hypothetical protein